MLECLIIGDSIAQGIVDYNKKCYSYTKVGISPDNFLKKYGDKISMNNKITIVSIGSNNPKNEYILNQNLNKIRNKINSKKILWILPKNHKIKKTILNFAIKNNDKYVEFQVGKDNVHPKSYKTLNDDIKNIILTDKKQTLILESMEPVLENIGPILNYY
jgi:hypothetical protein